MSDSATTESVRDTLEKAFETTEAPPAPERPSARAERAPPPPRPEPAAKDEKPPSEPAEAAEAKSDDERLVPPDGDRPRDQFGRFVRSSPEGPKPEEAPSAEPEPVSTDQPETTAAEPAPSPAIQPPASWSAAAKTEWNKLPAAVQHEVQRREQDVARGFEQRAQQIRDLEPIAQVIAPHAQKLALRGIHPAQAVQQLLAVQDMLERDPVEGVAYVARSYGVDLRQYATAYDQAIKSQQPQDPQVRQLSEQLAQVQGYLQAQEQAVRGQQMSAIQQEIQAFEADAAAHPHFASVRPAMAQLMQQGICQSLQDAYDHACWAIPEIRTQLLEQQKRAEIAQRQKTEREAAERARRAGVSVGGAPATGNGAAHRKDNKSLRSTIADIYEAVASR